MNIIGIENWLDEVCSQIIIINNKHIIDVNKQTYTRTQKDESDNALPQKENKLTNETKMK